MRKSIFCEQGNLRIRLHGDLCPDVLIEKTQAASGEWQPTSIAWGINQNTSVDHAAEMLHMLRSAVTVAHEWDEGKPKLFCLEMTKGGEKSATKYVNAYLKEHATKYFDDALKPDGYVLVSISEV